MARIQNKLSAGNFSLDFFSVCLSSPPLRLPKSSCWSFHSTARFTTLLLHACLSVQTHNRRPPPEPTGQAASRARGECTATTNGPAPLGECKTQTLTVYRWKQVLYPKWLHSMSLKTRHGSTGKQIDGWGQIGDFNGFMDHAIHTYIHTFNQGE